MELDKNALDRWITREPYDDGFSNWTEQVCDALTDEFYDFNSDWFEEYNGQCNKWLNSLFNKGKSPKESANIIETAFKFYKL